MVPPSAEASHHDASLTPRRTPKSGSRRLQARPNPGLTALPQRQKSQKMIPRDQRNDSPWQIPIMPPRVPSPDEMVRDSLSDDIFFRAYYDPSFRQVLLDWNDDLTKKHQSKGESSKDASPGATTFGTRDGKSPETCFDVMVMGQPKVGKTTFIARCLGIDCSEVHPVKPREVEFDGQTYWFRIRERSLSDIDARKPKTLENAHKKWEANPERIDAAVALYDLTAKESLDPLPVAMRAIQQTGKPCILAPTKADRNVFERQLNPDAVEKKVRMVVGKLKSTKPTAHPEGPYRCLRVVLAELVRLYHLPNPPGSRPRSKSSFHKLQAAMKPTHSRSDSKPSSSPPSRGQLMSQTATTFNRTHAPLPHYIAVAVDAANKSLPLDSQASPGSEPFSPLSPTMMQDAESVVDSEQGSSGGSEEFNPDTMKALPSHVMELATFEELVARVCFRDDPKKDCKFDFNFLVFYRFFASPLRLLNALISVYETASSDDSSVSTQLLPDRVLQFLSQWITTDPGDFADDTTYARLEEFLESFPQTSPFFPVAEQIRMASGKIDQDDDNVWFLPDAVDASECAPAGRKHSEASASIKSGCATDLDARLIFQAHSTLTVEAMGPTHTHTNSVDQSTIPYNITTMAQRQSALLDPSAHLPFTKIQWRQLMAQPDLAIARELTRIDWIMFSAIQPRDMVRHITVSSAERERFRELSNVTRWVEHFNHIAYWVTNLILLRDKPKHRALALEKLILVARRLRELNNYNALGAVIAGIHGTSVHRLSATRDFIPVDIQKNFMKLEVLMSTQKGHSTYRLAWENSNGPRIPFLPLHRRDLVVAEQGNRTWITPDGKGDSQDKRINWNKFNILGNMLWDLHEAQSTPYTGYFANEEIKTLVLEGGICKDDDQLFDRSQTVEPSTSGAYGYSGARRRFAPWLARYGL